MSEFWTPPKERSATETDFPQSSLRSQREYPGFVPLRARRPRRETFGWNQVVSPANALAGNGSRGTFPPVKIGIFGGTFDPVHNGHLTAARDAAAQLNLDRVVLVPAARAPLKEDGLSANAADRLAMLRAAVGHDPLFEVSDFEVRRGGVSYTIDTVRYFRERLPDAALHLIIGADQWSQLGKWKDAGEIARQVTLVVVERPGSVIGPPPKGVADLKWQRCEGHRLEIASSDIRARLRAGRPVDSLLPPVVAAYINERKLYA